MLTLQQLFDKAVANLLDQGYASWGHKGQAQNGCIYFDDQKNCRCVIGGLLDPGIDTTPFEGTAVTVDHPVNSAGWKKNKMLLLALAASGVPTDAPAIRLMNYLQWMHDGTPPTIRDNEFRKRIGLKPAPRLKRHCFQSPSQHTRLYVSFHVRGSSS